MKKLEVLQLVGYIVSIICLFIAIVLGVNWILHSVVSGKNIKCEHSDKKYTIEMTLINGAKTTKTYKTTKTIKTTQTIKITKNQKQQKQ